MSMASRVAAKYAGPKPVKMPRSVRSRINQKLIQSGLDGNGRFEKTGRALAKALDVLGSFGYELDDVADSIRLSRPDGMIALDVALTNEEDPFSPTPVSGTLLTLHWTALEHRVEVIAYMS